MNSSNTPAAASSEGVARAEEKARSAAADQRSAIAVMGLMSAAKLAQFSSLAGISMMAPDIASRVAMARRAGVQMERVRVLGAELEALGEDPMEAIARFIQPLDAFDGSLQPADWWEALVKGYVGQGVSNDLEAALISGLGGPWPERLAPVRSTGASRAQVAAIVSSTAASDERWASRLSLWGRRVFGEALSAVQHLVLNDPELAPLLEQGADDDAARLRTILISAHAGRMAALGLTA